MGEMLEKAMTLERSYSDGGGGEDADCGGAAGGHTR